MAESELDITLGEPDDDSMMVSMNESEALDETTQDSVNDESTKRSRSFGSRPLPVDVQHVQMHPSEILEYEWPVKSNKKYFIQEQISHLIGVTSFKRKYPDLSRRPMEPEERKYVVGDLKLKLP
uniref:Uncharacterized protein n=1 Tax=Panagrolaimus sp. JU765 TaxID=591449 RepID=A0AC34RCM8_9BILA